MGDWANFRPPVLVGERIVWLGSGSGIPQGGIVRWIGKGLLPEIGPDWTVGMELDKQLPYGGIDGTWGNRHLFSCKPKHGLIVPIKSVLRESDLFQRPRRQSGSSLQHGPTPSSRTVADNKPQEVTPQHQQQHKAQFQQLEQTEQLQQQETNQIVFVPAPSFAQPSLAESSFAEPSYYAEPIFIFPEVEDGTSSIPRPAVRRKKKTYPQRPSRVKRPPRNKGQANHCDNLTLPSIREESQESYDRRYDTVPSLSRCDTLKSADCQGYDADDKAVERRDEKCGIYEAVEVRGEVGIESVDQVREEKEIKSVDQVREEKEVESVDKVRGEWEIEVVNQERREIKSSYHVTYSELRDISNNEAFRHDQVVNKIMNNNVDTLEQTVVVTDGHSDNCKTHSSSQSGSGSRKDKVNSGFFSFLRWFRKSKDDDDVDDFDAKNGDYRVGATTPSASAPSSPQLVHHSHNSSYGSIDSVFSTATVSSFSFVAPTCYRPFGEASQPEKCIAVGLDTDTYRNRLRYRDRARELDRNLTLKKKYSLYASDSLSAINTPNASPVLKLKRQENIVQPDLANKEIQIKVNLASSPGSQNSTFGRKKRRAPVPPNLPKAQYSDYSLPSTLENKSKVVNGDTNNESPVSSSKTQHRRTASESSKDKKAGAYCHVKGKRKAPSPPGPGSSLNTPTSGTLEKGRSPFSSAGRKKRLAPQPPVVTGKSEVTRRKVNKECQVEQLQQTGNKTTLSNLSPIERDKLMSNIARLQAHADRRSMGSPPSSPQLAFRSSHHEQVVCNDSLKLERGVLKSNKEMPKVESPPSEVKVAPCSPRPWYKRSLTKSDSGGGGSGGLFKSLEKKKEKEKLKEDDWIPEGGIARTSIISVSSESSVSSNRFNIFSRLDKSDEKKKEEKRKSQVSMLANISELDREAAAIVQKEHARENAMMEAHDAKFYSYPQMPGVEKLEDEDETDNPEETPKRSSAKELISLFNAIGNVTRVTVNTSFFSKDGSSFFSKEGLEKRFSFLGESVRTTEEHVVVTERNGSDVSSPTVSSPGPRRKMLDLHTPGGSGVTIEEMEDELERGSKAMALYEANKSRRRRSPSPTIPTIAEQAESASSVATATPLATIQQPKLNGSCPVGFDYSKVWVCPRCTLENPRWKMTCDVCNRWRPSSSGDKRESANMEDPIERPLSPVPFMDEDREVPRKNDDQKTEKGKVLNWENELKRYFPDSPKVSRAATDVKADTKVSAIAENGKEVGYKRSENAVSVKTKVQTEEKNVVVQTQKSTEISKDVSVKKDVVTAVPSTFIGGRLKKDDEKNKVSVDTKIASVDKLVTVKTENGVIGSDLPTIEEKDVDELRKVRLAFFNRPADNITDVLIESKDVAVGVDAVKKPIDENERSKLKEMLKEMKNSLPKRPKNNGSQASSDETRKSTALDNNDIYKQIETSGVSFKRNSLVKEGSENNKHGAIKKVPQQVITEATKENIPLQKNVQDNRPMSQNGKVEALFITKTTVYENIKMRKPDAVKPQKVSSSAQTSGVVRKIDPSGMKPPSGKSNVDDLSSPIKDGVLYTSLSKDSRRIGKGTFELIRARDFKSIEVTKTGNELVPVHIYANMPSSPTEPSRSPKHILPQQPSAPSYEDSCLGSPKSDKLDDELPQSLQESSDQWSSATGSPIPKSPESRSGRESKLSCASGSASEASSYSVASCRSGDTSEVERLTAQLTLPKGLADFKANLQAAPAEQNNMNTLAVNRLLRRLEAAIAGGQHVLAAGLARDLARQKISCSVTRQRRSLDSSPAAIMVDMYVEDKVSHQGPIPLQVVPTMTVAQLKLKVEQEFEIPAGVQRWILGKLLASDDAKTLDDHNVNASGCPMFLYLVAPDGDQETDTGSVPETGLDNVDDDDEEDEMGPPQPAPPGKGWYYNYEEDHYSHCEDSDEELEDEVRVLGSPIPSAKDIVKPPSRGQIEEADDGDDEEVDDDDDEEVVDVAGVSGNVVIVHQQPTVIVDRPIVRAAPVQALRLPSAFNPVAGTSRGEPPRAVAPLVKHVEPVAKVTPENTSGTLKLGWQCPVCTLVNAPTRPGCAACTTERPLEYVVPTAYRANLEESQRLEREQQHDNDMQQATAEEKRQEVADQHQHYLQLVNLDKADLVPNAEPFDCSVCLVQYGPNEGTVLRECLHVFCRPCLVNTVQFNEEAEVKCPYRDANYACDSVLQEREIKALVPKNVYEQHLAKSVSQAENKIGNAFHCKTPDCRGWCIFEDNLNEFRCPVCIKTNCLTCQAIHDGIDCKQYQEQMKQASETNLEAKRTNDMLEDMVFRGEAMKCPTCHVVLMKKWGCDWLRCSMCKTEICWVTRGPRWGPGGKGDTTGGCQCGLLGIKCHPRCNYCH